MLRILLGQLLIWLLQLFLYYSNMLYLFNHFYLTYLYALVANNNLSYAVHSWLMIF